MSALCRDCRSWVKWRGNSGMGECRRYAPAHVEHMLVGVEKVFRGLWPVTFGTEGCDEAEPPKEILP